MNEYFVTIYTRFVEGDLVRNEKERLQKLVKLTSNEKV